jgi:hypothetical protein
VSKCTNFLSARFFRLHRKNKIRSKRKTSTPNTAPMIAGMLVEPALDCCATVAVEPPAPKLAVGRTSTDPPFCDPLRVFGRAPDGADHETVLELPVGPEALFEFPVFPPQEVIVVPVLPLPWLVVAGLFAVVVAGAWAAVVEDPRLFTATLNT